jgi:hypothetical protein
MIRIVENTLPIISDSTIYDVDISYGHIVTIAATAANEAVVTVDGKKVFKSQPNGVIARGTMVRSFPNGEILLGIYLCQVGVSSKVYVWQWLILDTEGRVKCELPFDDDIQDITVTEKEILVGYGEGAAYDIEKNQANVLTRFTHRGEVLSSFQDSYVKNLVLETYGAGDIVLLKDQAITFVVSALSQSNIGEYLISWDILTQKAEAFDLRKQGISSPFQAWRYHDYILALSSIDGSVFCYDLDCSVLTRLSELSPQSHGSKRMLNDGRLIVHGANGWSELTLKFD